MVERAKHPQKINLETLDSILMPFLFALPRKCLVAPGLSHTDAQLADGTRRIDTNYRGKPQNFNMSMQESFITLLEQ